MDMRIQESRYSDREAGKTVTIRYAVMCFTGKVRKNNEDNFYIDSRRLPLDNDGLPGILSGSFAVGPGDCRAAAVFDGVGGSSAGELASFTGAMALQKEEERLAKAGPIREEEAVGVCRCLNDAVCEAAEKNMYHSIGSTLAAAFFTSSGIVAANLGDSRGFAITPGGIRGITKLHVLDEIFTHSKPPIFQYLGVPKEEMLLKPHVEELPYEEGLQILLTTDGVTDLISDEELFRILTKNKTDAPAQSLEKIRGCVMLRGAKDNAAAVLCRIDPE